ncbi:flagellar motor switch phosphatase FliY [Viridibacillus sp. FSL R5-0477]|uniref:Flagellar motor switch protein n=1 Tax=Viridibacillus arenosi FSL R5-213 TaxID=1227360 RepID=W4F1B7_9BACL|nr:MULTISPECIES: flagellar motor switch phosphatase FliY [Viridibacillus]ETT85866.1 flagellar motor switch protein [Viridibacillus arenosi FSL R5-213]OMC89260.1 flagellar motor switch phosphatase FliY [Viridibacillus sp. FSL H7-0596]OMC93433.1 flagellar motor switch phosphatase FliY [Viridibacillus arenosi]
MSDEMLSQEEIEALLRGESPELENKKSSQIEYKVEEYLDALSQDALGEIGNISFGSSATALSSLLGQKVDITTPTISMINRDNLEEEFPHPYVAVQVEYTTGLVGMNLLVIKQSDAAIIADLMLGGDGASPADELGEIHLSAVQEAMNQMMGSAATSMSTIFNKKVDISPPSIDLMNISKNEGRDNIPEEDLLVKVSFRLKIGTLIDSDIMQLLPLGFSKKLVNQLLNQDTEEIASTMVAPAPTPQAAPVQAPPVQQVPVAQPAPMQEQQYQQSYAMPERPMYTQQPANVQQAQFASFENASLKQAEARNLNMLLDIPLQVTVELGRTKRSVKEILELASGSIIELDKLAGEPVDILVNSRLIAKGEVVVIDENFGVRITDILSKADRLNNLR